MRVSSPKKHSRKGTVYGIWRIFSLPPALVFSFVGALAFCVPALGRSPVDLSYTVRFLSRIAVHTQDPVDLAMNRHTLEAEQTAKLGSTWAFVAGGRVYADSAFAMNPRYDAPVRELESHEFVVRDLYLQYKGSGLQLRLGNQQVVWGESFGFFFADVVNPKDTREFGLGGDLAAQRITVPMANLVLFLGDHSLQFIAIPSPAFNMTPAQGSDFAYPFENLFPGRTIRIEDERYRPLSLSNTEFGFRASTLLGGWDLGLFYFNYFDRRPSYRPRFEGAETIVARGVHEPIQSFGFTGTKDLETWVTRFEAMYTTNRPVDAFEPDLINPQLSYYTALSDEFTGVLGFDYTQWRSWRLSLQLSHTGYFNAVPGALFPQHTTGLSVVVGGTVFNNHEFNSILGHSVSDGSTLLQLSYMVPLSNRLEAGLGAHLFFGPNDSQFGLFRSASRAFFQIKGFFGNG